MKKVVAAGLVLFVPLAGCASMAESQARKELLASCASRGENMRVAGFRTEKKEGLFVATGTAHATCLAPGDPGYDEAVPVEELQAE